MKKTWLSNDTHAFLKEKAKNDKKSIIETMDFLIEIFKQVNAKINTERPGGGRYNTYKTAFYEENKHLLEEHQRRYYESSKENMREFFEKNRKKLILFKIAFIKSRKTDNKERLKAYNKKYYQKIKKEKNVNNPGI
jgi:2,4-dienoyl-CoA reductase-like NADH-dependent reductase (Old Yellow Enzyme family)